MLTKELLSIYVMTVANEEGLVSSREEANELKSKIDSLDFDVFSAIIQRRIESLRLYASGEKESLFSPAHYKGQINTLSEILQHLKVYLSK